MTTEHHNSKAIQAVTPSTADTATSRIDTGRRAAVATLGGVLAAPFIIGSEARAQATWPNKPVRYINPFPAGGATDTLSRLYCVKMSELTGQQWVVENVGGGGGDIGVSAYARAQPDGYRARHLPTLKAGAAPRCQQGLHLRLHTVVAAQLPGRQHKLANNVPELIARSRRTRASTTTLGRHHDPSVRRALRCWAA
jgi:hypothetical protein